MNEIATSILSTLEETDAWITSSEIAHRLNLSTRTIKKYIAELNEEAENLIEASRKGYKLNKDCLAQFRSQLLTQHDIPQTPEERIHYILIRLLFEKHSSKLSAYELIDELYISESTFRSDCQKINTICMDFHCTLEVAKDLLWISGTEKNKRKILNSFIFQEYQKHFGDDFFIDELFPELDFSFIKNTVKQTFEQFHYFANDFSLNNFVRHVAIAIHRIQNGCNEALTETDEITKDTLEYQMAIQLTKTFEEHFKITFSTTEIYELTLLIICRGNHFNTNHVNSTEISTFVGAELIDFVRGMIQNTKQMFGIDLESEEFISRFCVHLHNLLIRNTNNLLNSNPLKNSIKLQCPFIYEMAVYMANQIQEHYHIHLNDDEITYITFHIGGILEMQKLIQSKLTAVLVLPEYYNLTASLTSKIEAQFQEELLILEVFATMEEYHASGIVADLLLTSISHKSYHDTQLVSITPFLTQNDIVKIRQSITSIKAQKMEEHRQRNIRKIFKKEFFSHKNSYATGEEAILDICSKLQQKHCVNESYAQEVMEREALSSTAFGGFSLPHSLHMNCLRTTIYVHIQEKGIIWGKQTIHVIFLLSVSKQERKMFREIFEYITDIINDAEKFSKIRKAKTYEEFIHLFLAKES